MWLFALVAALLAALAWAQPSSISSRRADLTYIGQTIPSVAPYLFVHLDTAAY
jgi:ABC-type proline/glycine betaine transport system permease subunit